MRKEIVIATGREKDILADITFDDELSFKNVVIFCHGYKGYKDWGAWNLVADEFAKRDCVFVKFNFSHNGGTLENPIDFPDLEAFGRNTYSKEVEDLNTVIDWAVNEFNASVNVIGHSRGGGIVTLVGASHSKVNSITTWASVADFKERFPTGDKLQAWKEKGVYHVVNGRTKQEMPHYFSFYEDFIQNEEALTMSKAAGNINVPHLIIHGDSDEAVSVEDADRLNSFNTKAERRVIKGGTHTFGGKHPWEENSLPFQLKEVVDATIKFIVSSNKM